MNSIKSLLLLLCGFFLSSCGSKQNTVMMDTSENFLSTTNTEYPNQDGPPSTHQRINLADISDAVPQHEPLSRYGNPSSYTVFGKHYYPLSSSKGYKQRGLASWYGSKFHGKRTSSGEPYNMHAMTAAHKTLPLPTYVKVTNLRNQRQVILKVNDRGPFHENRIIDLSHTAASKLGIIGEGTGLVEVEAIDPDHWAGENATITEAQANQQQQPLNPVDLYVQIGAFISAQNAQKLLTRVNRQLHQPAAISEVEANGQTFYRVRIGPLTSAEQADTLSFQLTQQGFGTPRILIE